MERYGVGYVVRLDYWYMLLWVPDVTHISEIRYVSVCDRSYVVWLRHISSNDDSVVVTCVQQLSLSERILLVQLLEYFLPRESYEKG